MHTPRNKTDVSWTVMTENNYVGGVLSGFLHFSGETEGKTWQEPSCRGQPKGRQCHSTSHPG